MHYISLNNNASSGKDAVKPKVKMQELFGDTNKILYQQLASFEYEAQRCMKDGFQMETFSKLMEYYYSPER